MKAVIVIATAYGDVSYGTCWHDCIVDICANEEEATKSINKFKQSNEVVKIDGNYLVKDNDTGVIDMYDQECIEKYIAPYSNGYKILSYSDLTYKDLVFENEPIYLAGECYLE